MSQLIYSPYIELESKYQPKKIPFTTVVTLSAAMVVGTGGILVTNNSSLQNSLNAKPFIQVADRGRRRLEQEGTIAELITKIRAAFGMSYAQLAYSLNVSRQTLYGWTHGTQPRAEALTRLWHMELVSTQMHKLSAPRKRALLLRPVVDGKNLLTLFREEGDVKAGIQSLLGTPNLESREAITAQVRTKRVRRFSVEDVSRVQS
jgi:DNA-binding transcriptional regulator YiaG